MNRKSASYMTLGIIVGLILLLVVTGVYFLFFKDIGVVTEGAVVDSTCKASLDLTAARLEGPFRTTLAEIGQPKCKTYDVLITQKDIDIISGQTGENDKNTIKRIIAQIMTTGIKVTTLDKNNKPKRVNVGGMWATVSGGQKRLFESEAGRFCLPWAVISFEDDVVKNIKTVDGLQDYLRSNNVITSRGDKLSTSYLGYLSNVVGDLAAPKDSPGRKSLYPINFPADASKEYKQPGTNEKIEVKKALEDARVKDSFKTSEDHALFYLQDVRDNWALIGAIAGLVAGVILVPFTVGVSGMTIPTSVLAIAAVGTTIEGYTLGGVIEGDGYRAAYTLKTYNGEGIRELNCNILK